MVPEPSSSENRTFICTVVFLDLVDYSRQPVGQHVSAHVARRGRCDAGAEFRHHVRCHARPAAA